MTTTTPLSADVDAAEYSGDRSPELAGHPTSGFTGTNCPVCGLAQFWCLGGVSCHHGHGFGSPDERDVQPKRPADSEQLDWFSARQKAEAQAGIKADRPFVATTATGSDWHTASQKGEAQSSELQASLAPEPQPTRRRRSAVAHESQAQPDAAQSVTQPAVAPKPTSSEQPSVSEPASVALPPTALPASSEVQRSAHHELLAQATATRIEELALGSGMDNIVETIFRVDVGSEFNRLSAKLRLDKPAHAVSKAVLFDELDAAEENALDAHRLYLAAKEIVRRFEADVVVLSVDMRAQATASLQLEKSSGQRSKQITDADVESRMAALFPDEWRRMEQRRHLARLSVDHMQRLSDNWMQRARDLRSMFESMR